MAEGDTPAVAPIPAPAERKWHRRADDEHEERLYQVPEAQAVPRMVMELHADAGNDRALQCRVDEVIVNLR